MSLYDLLVRNGMVVTASGTARADIAVENGRIVAVTPDLDGSAREEVDAAGVEREVLGHYRRFPTAHAREYTEMFDRIEQAAGQPVLIHCTSGPATAGPPISARESLIPSLLLPSTSDSCGMSDGKNAGLATLNKTVSIPASAATT